MTPLIDATEGKTAPSRVAETVTAHLSVYFGAHTARTTVERFSRRALGHASDALEMSDVRPLLTALRQPLGTLLGQAQCEIVIRNIEASCRAEG